MAWVIRVGAFLLCCALILGVIDEAQLWWRERFDHRLHIQVQGCQDIQYAIDHAGPQTVLHLPRGECIISESLVLVDSHRSLSLIGGYFVASPSLGDNPVFSIVQ